MGWRKILTGLLLLAALAIGGMLYLIAANAPNPADQRQALAIARMTSGLILFWVLTGGGLMLRYRAQIAARTARLPLRPALKFVLFCILMACIEEAVTTTMTNLAPLFGVPMGAAYITASANYIDVILFHSVVVFIPFFIAMAAIRSRFAVSPFALFVSFGMVGTLAECLFAANPAMLVMFPLWLFVYGLMVWLPAHAVPTSPRARPPGWVHLLLLPPAILLLALPMILPVVWLIAVVLAHPSIDFAPL